MVRGVRWWLFAGVGLVALAGCGRGFMNYVQREPWREQAETACIKSGTVREGPTVVRISPIEGPGMCGATQPLKVTAFGVASAFGYADEPVRPPGGIAGPRWPVAAPPRVVSSQPMPSVSSQPLPALPSGQPRYVPSGGPRMLEPPPGTSVLLQPPGARPQQGRPVGAPMSISAPGIDPYAQPPRNPNEPDDAEDDDRRIQTRPAAPPPSSRPLPSLGPQRGPRVTGQVTPVEVKPAATLACPIVSALEQWIVNAVQPAAHKWFGQPVVEIKQISAYSCRGMNGQVGARISEHAFGNALDIAAFVLADGKRITIKSSWHGSAEEQGFLRDVQAAACDQFTTVLAPGSNRFHYDHIHVDLMRRASGRRICQPGAVDGDLIAARVRQKGGAVASRSFEPPPTRRYDPPFDARNDPFAWRGDRRSDVTSSIGPRRAAPGDAAAEDHDWIEDPSPRPPIDWSTDRHRVY
jgi:hypothetical protein